MHGRPGGEEGGGGASGMIKGVAGGAVRFERAMYKMRAATAN